MEEKELKETLCNQIEEELKNISQQRVQQGNVEYLYKLIDVKKDIKNIEYWKEKIDIMRNRYSDYGDYGAYGEYGEYGEYGDSYGRRMRDSRGRYMDYGARGNYRGDEMMNDMNREYHNYSDYRDSYGAGEPTTKSLTRMLQSLEDFMRMLKNEAKSEKEMQMIKESARKISEM